jgi:hypothetical protein
MSTMQKNTLGHNLIVSITVLDNLNEPFVSTATNKLQVEVIMQNATTYVLNHYHGPAVVT